MELRGKVAFVRVSLANAFVKMGSIAGMSSRVPTERI